MRLRLPGKPQKDPSEILVRKLCPEYGKDWTRGNSKGSFQAFFTRKLMRCKDCPTLGSCLAKGFGTKGDEGWKKFASHIAVMDRRLLQEKIRKVFKGLPPF